MSDSFEFQLVSPAGRHVSKTVWQVSARSRSGMFAVRAHHEAFFASLGEGLVEVAASPDARQTFEIGEGFLSFQNNQCRVFCEAARASQTGGEEGET